MKTLLWVILGLLLLNFISNVRWHNGLNNDCLKIIAQKDSLLLKAKEQIAAIAIIEPKITFVNKDSIAYTVVIKNGYDGTFVSDKYPRYAKNVKELISGVQLYSVERKCEILNKEYPISEFLK